MLKLSSDTDDAWVSAAAANIDEVLLDHAHCEKKAAGAAIKLLFAYPEQRALQEPLAELAREELTHFQQVLAQLDARGLPFKRQRPSAYGGRLRALVATDEPERLVDLLVVSAVIEARSCERLKRLSEALPDASLADFYASLVASEARHHRLYLDLAESVAAPEVVRARLRSVAAVEAEILREPAREVRMHAGAPCRRSTQRGAA